MTEDRPPTNPFRDPDGWQEMLDAGTAARDRCSLCGRKVEDHGDVVCWVTEDREAELRDVLNQYGNHGSRCAVMLEIGSCDCGWQEWLDENADRLGVL